MPSKPATQRGLNLELTRAQVNALARVYARINRVALTTARRVLAAALRDGTMAQALAEIQAAVEAAVPDGEVQAAAEKAAQAQNRRARRLFFPALAAATGLALIGSDAPERALPSAVLPSRPQPRRRAPRLVVRLNMQPEILADEFVGRNVQLISTLRAGVADGVADAVVRAQVLGEADPEELAARLLREWEKNGVPSQIPINRTTRAGGRVLVSAESHARFIARDQLGTLNGQLAQARQTAAGISEFEWMPSTAAEPRESHRAFYGKVYRWDEGAGPDGIVPGQEINCQCHARAIVNPDAVRSSGDFIDVDAVGDVFGQAV
jgi:SPP1 gp7 family putative phage head morphogenesis protein